MTRTKIHICLPPGDSTGRTRAFYCKRLRKIITENGLENSTEGQMLAVAFTQAGINYAALNKQINAGKFSLGKDLLSAQRTLLSMERNGRAMMRDLKKLSKSNIPIVPIKEG